MSQSIVTLKKNNIELEFSRDKPISLTKLWKMAGSPENKNPGQWTRLPGSRKLVTKITKELEVGKSHLLKTRRGKPSETFAHYKLAIEYAGYIDIGFKSWCLEQIGRLIAEPEELAADILIASHNKERVERAKKGCWFVK